MLGNQRLFFLFSALSQWLLQKAIFDLTNLESSFAKLHNVVHITLKIQSKVLNNCREIRFIDSGMYIIGNYIRILRNLFLSFPSTLVKGMGGDQMKIYNMNTEQRAFHSLSDVSSFKYFLLQ